MASPRSHAITNSIVFRRLPLLLGAAAFITGCAATPQASEEANAYAQRFDPRKDAAVIFVYRDDRFAPQTQYTGLIDGRVFGQILPTTFFRLVEYPGPRVVSLGAGTNARIVLEARAGVVYFIRLQAPGRSGAQMREVSPEQGKRDIMDCCDLMENWRRGQQRLLF